MECLIARDYPPTVENTWDRHFDVVPASTPELLDQIFALRYQVYCVEHRFENPAKFPTGRETDCHDPFSLHVALIYRGTGEVAGTVRLIFPAGETIRSLPILTLLGPDAQAELLTRPLDGIPLCGLKELPAAQG